MDAWAVCEHQQPLQKLRQPIPELKNSEVLIEVTHCGVCHSDLHFWEGFYNLGGGKRFHVSQRGVKLPIAPGHEIVGIVSKVGPQVQDLAVGSRQIVFPWLGCGQCRRCRQGDDNLCSNQSTIGVMSNGGFASHVVVPHPRYLVDPGDIDPAFACTLACSGLTVLSAIRKIMPLEADDSLVLIGAGGLGLAAINVLRALGHEKIIVVEPKADNRKAAVDAGASAAIDSAASHLAADVLAAAGGDILGVIDFVNNSDTAALALGILAKGGKMVQVGVMGGELTLSLVPLIFKAVTIMGNNTGNLDNLREVVALARDGKLAPIPITRVPWDEANSALTRLHDGQVTGRLVLEREQS